MNRRVRQILIPVDFTENTRVAISRALEMVQEDGEKPTLHLLHCQQFVIPGIIPAVYQFFSGNTRQQTNDDLDKARTKLGELESWIHNQSKEVQVVPWTICGEPVEEAIIRKAKTVTADLIIIGKKSHHSILPFLNTVVPNKIASLTGLPVLTIKPGSLNQPVRTVVIPISGQFPASKLRVIESLKFKTSSQFRLVIFRREETAETKQCLIQAFRTLKNILSNPIKYEIIDGVNKAKALLSYSEKVGADMLIVNPGAETRVNTWANSHISDCIPRGSKTQILAIGK